PPSLAPACPALAARPERATDRSSVVPVRNGWTDEMAVALNTADALDSSRQGLGPTAALRTRSRDRPAGAAGGAPGPRPHGPPPGRGGPRARPPPADRAPDAESGKRALTSGG